MKTNLKQPALRASGSLKLARHAPRVEAERQEMTACSLRRLDCRLWFHLLPSNAAAFAAVLALLAVLVAPVARAQYTTDYQTNTISGVGSNWSGAYVVGSNNTYDVLQVINGGGLTNGGGYIGYEVSATGNVVLVSGANSLWQNTGDLNVGYNGPSSQLIITNGGRVVNVIGYVGNNLYAANNGSNVVLVSGVSSFWQNSSTLYMGRYGAGNQLFIANSGHVNNVAGIVGFNASSSNNLVVVSGNGSGWTNTSYLAVGSSSSGNQLIITNGGMVRNSDAFVGNNASANNNKVVVSDSGSIWTNTGNLYVGTLGSGNQLVITNGGSVFATSVTVGGAGTTGSTVRIESGGLLNANTLAMTNGVNSTFAFSGGALNTKFTLIGAGSVFTVTNHGNAQISGLITNNGVINVVNSMVTWQSNVVIGGSYVSDPSTNIFRTNVMVTTSGSLLGNNGAFVFSGDFNNQSTNRAQFDLSRSMVLFTNGSGVASHTLNLTNSGAVDMGAVGMNAVQLATNFSIGTLSIAPSNRLTLIGAKPLILLPTNALYVGWLDIQGAVTNGGFTALTNSLYAALDLPGINLYYDMGDSRNAYLGSQTYDLWGGQGLLIPVPEPSALMLTLAATAFSAFILRRKGGRM